MFDTYIDHMESAKVPARDLVVDAKAATRRDPCRVLQQIASCKETSADAPLYKVMRQNGLTLGLKFSYDKISDIERYPYIDPRDFVEHLEKKGFFYKVAGLPEDITESVLPKFWSTFKQLHPAHPIFDQYVDLSRVIPYYLHGDGGRGYKKDPIEIFSMLPALGSGTRKKPIELAGNKRNSVDPCFASDMAINLRGNSATTRFLFTVLGSFVAKKHPKAFDDITDLWGRKLASLFADGFQACGTTWRIAIIGFTGDSPFVKKVAHLTRSFNNVRKFGASTNAQKGCCWLCRAGFENAEESIPFEHLGLWEPLWIQTTGIHNILPWSGTGGPLLAHVMYDDGPSFFRPDLFHIYHSGVGKDFVASSLIYAMKEVFALGGVKRNLTALNEILARFVKKCKIHLHCGYLTEDNLGYAGTREYPEGHWSKNQDTAILMRFIVVLLQQDEFKDTVQQDAILSETLLAAVAMGKVMRRLLESDYFMSSSDCEFILQNGHTFLLSYQRLAAMSYQNELCLFKLKPKIHYLNHIFLTIKNEWLLSETAVNPCAEATFMSEDFVGQVARISRRVDARAVAIKTLQRYDVWVRTAMDADQLSMLDLSWLD